MQFEILHADLTNHDIFIVHYSWTQPSRIRYRLQSTEKTVYTTHTAQCIPLMHACFCRVLRTFLRILPRIGTCIKVQIIYLYWTYSAHLWVDIYFYWRYCCAFGCRFGKCAFSRVCANILEYLFLKCKHFPIDIYNKSACFDNIGYWIGVNMHKMGDKNRSFGAFVPANTPAPVLALSLTRCLVHL